MSSVASLTAAARRVFPIAGVGFDLVTPQMVLDTVLRWKVLDTRHSIALVNPHSVLLCQRDPKMRAAISRSGLTLPDGAGIVLAARLLSYPHGGRVSGPELMLYLCDHGRAHQFRHYFYGGGDGVAERLAANLQATYPGLCVAGWHTPPFQPNVLREDAKVEEATVLELIRRSRTDILWVGLGAPKQEKWIERNRDALRCHAIIGVGAAFDFHSGRIPWCPAPVRRLGLEWAYRLMLEPKRLWRRNLDSFTFLATVARQRLGALAGEHPRPVVIPYAEPTAPAPEPLKARGAHA